ncbi:apolipoprotein N-acyltransferase [Roseofilum casamattae]|uniref:Apolipoprotein N-acyltransferase n=1 Tax=Roseofilum casamattae BLCC-M143 TaxID=3022442 RepID=A0ABT7BSM3_9CYAN|nr:apolipoprotein N-acyltransferase [Roseofilum casamattae]MDJ1182188.1 apolipoprotein N-acyltransferase [Roseofilum casamattae BLCC-M143]
MVESQQRSDRTQRELLISLVGGILMGLTTAPVKAWPLAWIALIPLWICIRRSSSWKSTLSYGLVWGIGFHGIALFWITGIHPMTWLGVPWLASLTIAISVWVFITLWGSALVAIWALLLQRFPGSTVLAGTALWCLLEGIWSTSDLWWSSLSYTQSPFNLAILHLGQLSGPNAVTAVLVAFNGCIAESIAARLNQKSDFRSTLISGFLLIILAHGMGYWLYQNSVSVRSPDTFKVGIIQGNIPNEIKLYSQGWREALAGYARGYQKLADRNVDIVLTPETALPFLWTNPNQRYSALSQAIRDRQIPVWIGAFGKQGDRLTNSLFTLDKTGEIISQYDKTKLVPLGEYIPFESIVGKLINRLSPLEARLARGSFEQIVKTPVGQAIVGICYDSAFSQLFRQQTAAGGEFIITASNDAHYSSAMQWQHHAQDVMRAIECDRDTVRATNTGYSAIVDHRGITRWISERDRYQIHSGMIERRRSQTPYVRWGDWLVPLLWIMVGVGWVRSQFTN